MDNIKDKKYFISKVLENLYDISAFMKDASLDDFAHNALLQSAVSFKFIQAYENAKNLDADEMSEEFRITLIKLKGFRNLIVHEYGKADIISVFDTATKDVPSFIKTLEKEIK